MADDAVSLHDRYRLWKTHANGWKRQALKAEAERDQLVELIRETRNALDNWAAPRDEIAAVLDSALSKMDGKT